jgi:ABC-type Zn uptake system ZnuABC Zn-binding protein ZnuA
VNGVLIARNIAAGLKRIDPRHADAYDANLASFEDRVLRRLYGDRLVDIVGAQDIVALARDNRFWDFAASQVLQGRPLTDYIGGWLAQAAPFRDRRMVCYHRNWAYLSARFRVECAMFVERKPGIPPSPGHVGDVISFIQAERIPVIFAANYFSRSQVERVASRTGARAVVVPEHVDGEEGINDYFALVDRWVSGLAAGFGAAQHR